MGNYDRLVKDFFRKTNPSNPLHYYGYKHIVRGEIERSEKGDIARVMKEERALRSIKCYGHEN